MNADATDPVSESQTEHRIDISVGEGSCLSNMAKVGKLSETSNKCKQHCFKCCTIFVTFLFVVVGLTLLVFGIVVYANKHVLESALKLKDAYSKLSGALKEAGVEDDFSTFNIGGYLGDLTYSLIMVGVIFIIISLLSCCGIINGVRQLMLLCIICLFVFSLVEIVAISYMSVASDNVDGLFKKPFKKAIIEDYTGIRSDNSFTRVANIISSGYQCCGVDNYKEFLNARKWDRHIENRTELKQIPTICCFNRTDLDCLLHPRENNSYAYTGCYNEVKEQVKKYKDVFFGISIPCIVVQILICFWWFHIYTRTRTVTYESYIPTVQNQANAKPDQAANANPEQAANANPEQAANANPEQAANANPEQAANANPEQAVNT